MAPPRGNPALAIVKEGEIMSPVGRDVVSYTHGLNRLRGVGGRPSRVKTEQELIELITSYVDQLQNEDGVYVAAPSLAGLGAYLGYSSASWHEHSPFKDIIGHFKLWLQGWRESKAVIPRGGINPAGLMFAMSLDAKREARPPKPISPSDAQPAGVAAVIEEVWRKKGTARAR